MYLTFQPGSLPLSEVAFDGLIQCCWVESKKEPVSSLPGLLAWIFQNGGTSCALNLIVCNGTNMHAVFVESEASNVVIEKLVQVIRHICFDSTSKNTAVLQGELLHIIVSWSRENKVRICSKKHGCASNHFFNCLGFCFTNENDSFSLCGGGFTNFTCLYLKHCH